VAVSGLKLTSPCQKNDTPCTTVTDYIYIIQRKKVMSLMVSDEAMHCSTNQTGLQGVQELTSCLDQHNILMNVVLDLPYI
jgi:hypothetical protein